MNFSAPNNMTPRKSCKIVSHRCFRCSGSDSIDLWWLIFESFWLPSAADIRDDCSSLRFSPCAVSEPTNCAFGGKKCFTNKFLIPESYLTSNQRCEQLSNRNYYQKEYGRYTSLEIIESHVRNNVSIKISEIFCRYQNCKCFKGFHT